MNLNQLEQEIAQHVAAGPAAVIDSKAMTTFLELRSALEAGSVRAAEPDAASPTGWRVNAWVKQGILLGFRLGALEEMPSAKSFFFTACHSSTKTPSLPAASQPAMACAWFPAAHRYVPGRTWHAASSACHPCTST